MAWPTVGIITAAVGLAAALAWWLWWGLPKRQVNRFRISDPKTRADIEDNLRKTSGQLLGGAAVLIGAGLAYLQFTQQQEASQQQFSHQQQASRDLLISNQVSKGFEQLGSDKLVVRLGGIYALEGVMNTSERYHQPVLEALSAFVRDGSRTETHKELATDIQAALTVLGRREAIGTGAPNLSGAHLAFADLRGSNLRGADLNLANLTAANLSDANLSDANLSDANLLFANLSGADLSGAKLDGQVFLPGLSEREERPWLGNGTGTNLSGANLSGADLSRAKLGGGLTLGANLIGANLSDAKLHGADLSGADLRGAIVAEANASSSYDLSRTTTILQRQLDQACGTNVKLDPGLTLKRCSEP